MSPKTLTTLALLRHMRDSAEYILEKTREKSLQLYLLDRDLQQIVERNFEIIGEAMRRLSRHDPTIADRISGSPDIIAFRNVLIHAYDEINHVRVWQIVERQLPVLHRELGILIQLVRQSDGERGSS